MKINFKIIIALILGLTMLISSIKGIKELIKTLIYLSKEGKEGYYIAVFFILWIIISLILAVVFFYNEKRDFNMSFSLFLSSFLLPLLSLVFIVFVAVFIKKSSKSIRTFWPLVF